MTLSPGLRPLTPAPISLTTPASSLPGENGSGGLNWYLFWMMSTSGKLTLAALTATTTSPGPGCGAATSSTTSDSGGPYCLQSTAFIVGLHYANALYRRRRQALLRGGRQRHADRFRARVRRRPSQLGGAAALLLAPLSLHRLQRARLPAFRSARGVRALFAGARARRHPLRARCPGPAACAHRGPFDGGVRHAALRHELRIPRAFAHRGGRRLRRPARGLPAGSERIAPARPGHPTRRHCPIRRGPRPLADPRAGPEQGSAAPRRSSPPAPPAI